MFYIQMQLCEHSLKDWIFERNMKPKEELTSNCNGETPALFFFDISEQLNYQVFPLGFEVT